MSSFIYILFSKTFKFIPIQSSKINKADPASPWTTKAIWWWSLQHKYNALLYSQTSRWHVFHIIPSREVIWKKNIPKSKQKTFWENSYNLKCHHNQKITLMVIFRHKNINSTPIIKKYLVPRLNNASKDYMRSWTLRVYSCCTKFSVWEPLQRKENFRKGRKSQ